MSDFNIYVPQPDQLGCYSWFNLSELPPLSGGCGVNFCKTIAKHFEAKCFSFDKFEYIVSICLPNDRARSQKISSFSFLFSSFILSSVFISKSSIEFSHNSESNDEPFICFSSKKVIVNVF